MPHTQYCWRCQMDIPMLDEAEWQQLEVLMKDPVRQGKHHMHVHGRSHLDAKLAFEQPVLDAYERLTGFHETNYSALFHHRLSIYGPACHACGKPLRTPQARSCAACGAARMPPLDGA